MSTETKKRENLQDAFPNNFTNESERGMTLRDYAQVKFISAIISNADTMRELTKTWNSAPKDKRIEFEELIAKIGGSYADAMLKQREL